MTKPKKLKPPARSRSRCSGCSRPLEIEVSRGTSSQIVEVLATARPLLRIYATGTGLCVESLQDGEWKLLGQALTFNWLYLDARSQR
jgi:hypothetical protein